MKKRAASIFLALCLLLQAASGFASPEVAPPSNPDLMMKILQEGPLQQKDVDGFLQTNDDVLALKKDTLSEAETEKIFLKNFSSISRGYYVFIKVAMAYEQLENGMQFEGVPDNLIPTAAELELVKKNLPALRTAHSKLTQ